MHELVYKVVDKLIVEVSITIEREHDVGVDHAHEGGCIFALTSIIAFHDLIRTLSFIRILRLRSVHVQGSHKIVPFYEIPVLGSE